MQKIELRSSLSREPVDGSEARSDVWIDFGISDDEGRQWLLTESGIDDEAVNDLVEQALATYWRRFGRGFLLNVHASIPGAGISTYAIVDFGIWLEPGRIVTIRRGEAEVLDKAAAASRAGAGPSNCWDLIVFILSEALSRVESNLRDLNASIDQLEDEIVTGEGGPPIPRVAELQRRLIYARRFRLPLANIASFISSQPRSVIDGELRDDVDGVVNAVKQHQQMLGLSIERVSSLHGQVRDMLADSMNKATYRFTWVATVFLPLSFLTGLLGINVAGIPGDHNPLAFWVVCGALCVIAAAWGVVVGRLTGQPGGRSGLRHR